MANNDIWLGANFDIDTSGLDAGLKKANKLIRESESEFKAAAAGLEDWQSSSKGLQARINHLNNTTDIQRKKIDALNKEYDRLSKEGLDPTSDKMIKLKTDINNEKAALAKNETELKQQSKALEDLGKEADDTSKDVKELDEEVDKISFGLKALKGVSKVAVTSIAAIGAAAVGAVAGFLSLAESTREYREDINKLQTGFQTAGFTAEQATDVYKEFYAVLGEEDRSVEAVNHLAKLCDTQEDLNKWTDIATGVWATFGDSLPIEGLTEASNEVAKTGELTGVLVDALNWAGVSEDEFKKKLEACNSESERASLITETLNDLYADSADKYRELNKDIMDAQRAQSELTDAMAELGAIAEPIMTDLKLLVSDFVRELTPFVEVIGKGLAGAFKGSEDAAENLSNGISGLVNMLINNFVSMLPVVLSTIVQIVPSIVKTLLDAAPQLIDTIIFLVSEIMYAINDSAPQIIEAIAEIVPQIVNKLIEGIPYLLEGATDLLMTLVQAIEPTIMALLEALPSVLETLLNALVEMQPTLFEGAKTLLFTIVDAIPTIINGLIDTLPSILETITDFLTNSLPTMLENAKNLLMQIVRAIPSIVSSLVQNLPTIIATILNVLSSSLPDIINGAVQMFMGIILAIPDICIELIKNMPTIIKAIVDGLLQGIPQLVDAGWQLIKGMFQGMVDAIGSGIKAVGDKLISGFKSVFGIHSPSRVFRDKLGSFMGEGLALGIVDGFEDNLDGVNKAILSGFETPTINNTSKANRSSNGYLNGSNGVVVNQYNTFSQAHSRYELFKSKQATAAAVRLAVSK